VIEYSPLVLRFSNKRWFKSVTETVGGMLITLGVAGELYAEVRSSCVEGQLRVVENTIVRSICSLDL
jgi:hypothetical protein